jgi:hypothetical protein
MNMNQLAIGTCLCVVIHVSAALADDATIVTVAGTGAAENNGNSGRATEINLGDPFGVEIGPQGALVVTEVRNHRVWRIDLASGEASVIAGRGRQGYSGDGGPAIDAEFNSPHSIALDGKGGLYVADIGNHRVRGIQW